MPIRRLNRDTHRQIRSFCVLDGCLAVAAELVDNSVEAGARRVEVRVDEQTGGLAWLEVRDDGCGIAAECAPAVCLRHQTSKGSDCCSQGAVFRGEALFAVAHVAGEMHLASRCREESVGIGWTVDVEGELVEGTLRKVACPVGTTVTVKELFDRLPVRRKSILSKDIRERLKDIQCLIRKYALCHQSIRFELQRFDTNFRTRVSSDIYVPQEARSRILGKKRLLEDRFEVVGSAVSVDFCVTEAESKPMRLLSINKRSMNLTLGVGKQLVKATKELFGENYPSLSWLFLLEIDSDVIPIDLNIEPRKDDVLIKDFERIVEEIKTSLIMRINGMGGVIQKDKRSRKGEEDEEEKDQSKATFIDNDVTLTPDDHEDEWMTSMYQRLSSRTGSSIDSSRGDIPTDEDIHISTDLSISNPFTLMKMAGTRNENQVTPPVPSISRNKPPRIVHHQGSTPVRNQPQNSALVPIVPMRKSGRNPTNITTICKARRSDPFSKRRDTSGKLIEVPDADDLKKHNSNILELLKMTKEKPHNSIGSYLESSPILLPKEKDEENDITIPEVKTNEINCLSTSIRHTVSPLNTNDAISWFEQDKPNTGGTLVSFLLSKINAHPDITLLKEPFHDWYTLK